MTHKKDSMVRTYVEELMNVQDQQDIDEKFQRFSQKKNRTTQTYLWRSTSIKNNRRPNEDPKYKSNSVTCVCVSVYMDRTTPGYIIGMISGMIILIIQKNKILRSIFLIVWNTCPS